MVKATCKTVQNGVSIIVLTAFSGFSYIFVLSRTPFTLFLCVSRNIAKVAKAFLCVSRVVMRKFYA